MFRLLLAALVAAFFMPAYADEPEGLAPVTQATAEASSAVMACLDLRCSQGHGSGVYIGNGYFLTAGHVVDAGGNREWILKSEAGHVIRAQAVWRLVHDDIALLHTNAVVTLPAAPLACRDLIVGEAIIAITNPGDFQFFRSEGYIAAQPTDWYDWNQVYPAVLPVTFGSSGGPAYSADGELLGLVVGGNPDNQVLMVIEPASKVCGLLPTIVASAS